jgi:hypothetical protein
MACPDDAHRVVAGTHRYRVGTETPRRSAFSKPIVVVQFQEIHSDEVFRPTFHTSRPHDLAFFVALQAVQTRTTPRVKENRDLFLPVVNLSAHSLAQAPFLLRLGTFQAGKRCVALQLGSSPFTD